MKRDRTTKRRRKLARAVERATVPGTCLPLRTRGAIHRLPRHQYSVRALATLNRSAIRDETRTLNEEILDEVLMFVTDAASPFFGRDVPDALREAVRLQHLVVSGATTHVSAQCDTARSRFAESGSRLASVLG
jgi:hypothetical protein